MPSRRAVLGGFLVAVAAVSVFAAYRRAQAPPMTSYAVVTTDVAPGQRLEAAHVRMQLLDLPAQQAETAADPNAAVGGIATHQLVEGQLLTRTDVRESDGYIAGGEVALELASAQALAGSLQPGERVDVLATFGSGDDARTAFVVRDALVVAVAGTDGLAGSDTVIVRLGVAGADDALAITHAAGTAQTSLVRVDGPAGADEVRSPGAADEAGDGS